MNEIQPILWWRNKSRKLLSLRDGRKIGAGQEFQGQQRVISPDFMDKVELIPTPQAKPEEEMVRGAKKVIKLKGKVEETTVEETPIEEELENKDPGKNADGEYVPPEPITEEALISQAGGFLKPFRAVHINSGYYQIFDGDGKLYVEKKYRNQAAQDLVNKLNNE